MNSLEQFTARAAPGRRFLAHCLAVLAVAVQLPAQAQTQEAQRPPLPMKVTLAKECGVDKNTPLPDRQVDFCPNGGTTLIAAIEPGAVAGRRLVVTMDLDTADGPDIPAQLSLASFGASPEPMTSSVTVHLLTPGRLQISVYVPNDARQVWWAFTGGWGGINGRTAQVRIRRIEAQISQQTLASGTMCAPCKTYLDNVLEQVRTHFLFIDEMPFDTVARGLRESATGAENVAELDSALKLLARKLNEAERSAGAPAHSYYWTRSESAMMSASPLEAHDATSAKTSFFNTQLLNGRVGYVRFRGFLCPEMAQCQIYARDLRSEMVRLYRQGARTWVIDLRPHTGGNMWPALAALRPLLGSGTVGYFLDAAGRKTAAWTLGTDNAAIAGQRYFTDPPPFFDASSHSVAVLVGGQTSSSGEMLAIAFQARRGTRSFGMPTSGYITGVYNPPDPYGNVLGIAGTYVADRHSRRVFPRIVPDVTVDAHGSAENDATLDQALGWLAKQQ